MIYTAKIKKAINFSIQIHELDQKQKRKGKDIPYIMHPLTAGLILSRAGANEDIVVAGILHDTIEDSTENKKVTREILVEKFGETVADLVVSVTETDKKLPWKEKKAEALDHIRKFGNDSLLLKSADVLSNISEILDDHENDGESVFDRFGAPKDEVIENYLQVVGSLIERWSRNPLEEELRSVASKLHLISGGSSNKNILDKKEVIKLEQPLNRNTKIQ